MTPTSPSTERPSAPPPRRTWDLVLTIVLMVLLLAAAGLAALFAAFLAFASDGCGTGACDYDRVSAGILVAMILPAVLAVAAIVVAIVALVRRRLAFWIPLAGAALMCGAWLLGAAITFSGVPGAAP